MKWRRGMGIESIDVNALLHHQEIDNICMSVLGRQVKSSPFLGSSSIDIRTFVYQELENLQVSLPGSEVKWSPPFVACNCVDFSVVVQQKLYNIYMFPLGGQMKWCPLIRSACIDISVFQYQ